MNRNFFSAVAILIGSVIGVGIFGIPLVFSKAGFLIGLLFLIGLTITTILTNLAFGEVILRTDRRHQIIGYAEVYLGRISQRVASLAFILSIYAALLAYIIVGGQFLANILSSWFYFSVDNLSFIFFLTGAVAVAGGLRLLAEIDLAVTLFYILAIGSVLALGWGKVDFNHFALWQKGFWFLPYGVLLFALNGSSIVLQREVLDGEEQKLKKAIIWGTSIPALLYLIFAVVVVGVSGQSTSPEALTGLLPFLGEKVVIFGSLFGVVAIFTSFVNLGKVLQESFQYDFGLKRWRSWLLAILPPWLFFSIGVKNFINIISLAGAVAIGLQTIILILIYNKARRVGHRIPEYSLNLPPWFWYGLIGLSAFGIFYTLFT